MPAHLKDLQPRGEFHIPGFGTLTGADVQRAVRQITCPRLRAEVRAALRGDRVDQLRPAALRAVRAQLLRIR